ncbi:cyclic nucleotide-binding domain-containing protein [Desulfofundulus thermobenzoicus]|uniref:Cyclic nucleotide-binding domain-containing protein n=1 Tax=Desulfofundulus thermobenzoicus TaxID=29376 RepID=A0A6N7ITN8_9FIRM|nr:Crp/Fnr family transcriptional regulator [Desulfofundulus thermobenzoicus]MQL52827.1 cyclic nucleotide-binding domain-containing protein [Desulfofundulus thermobenzoicus]
MNNNFDRVDLLEELSRYLQNLPRQLPRLRAGKGMVILTPEDTEPVLYLIQSGQVQLYKLTPDGKQCTLTILHEGDIFGETHLFCTGCRQIYASALSDALLYEINTDLFYRLLEENPGLAIKMLAWTTRRLKETEDLLERIAYGDVRTRILYLLLRLCEDFGVHGEEGCLLDIRLTHQDLAHMVAASRETVSAMLSRLARDGLLKSDRRPWLVDCRGIHKQLAECLPADMGKYSDAEGKKTCHV